MATNDVSNMRQPDYFNATRQAWRGRDLRPDEADVLPGAIRLWLVCAPGVHAFWSRWVLATYDLLDRPGLAPAKLHRPGMTHEFCAAAVNPAAVLDPDDPIGWLRAAMTPLDLVVQVGGIDDMQAERILDKFVQACVAGQTHPDSDYRERNVQLVTVTAAHVAAGRHEVN